MEQSIISKRPKLEEILQPHLSLDAKYELLKRADAKDAMNYAISGDRDIVRLLRNDNIWKFWFQRDLDIIYTDEIPNPFPRDGEQPIWKRWYLWCRLFIGMIQWNIIKTMSPVAYPPNYTITYVNLNVMKATKENKSLYLDFRSEFPRIMSTIKEGYFVYNKVNMFEFASFYIFTQSMKLRYFEIDEGNLVINYLIAMAEALMELSGIFQDHNNPYLIFHHERMKESPNMFKLSKYIVVGCNVCQSTNPQYKCSRCDKPYCSEECARHDWSNNRC